MEKVKFYLPFEIDFIHSDAHSELIERYGAHGLGVYFMVLMELRNHEGYRCSLSTIKGVARRCLADPEMLESVLRDFQLFEFVECGHRILISSVYIDRVMQSFEEKTCNFSSTVNEKTVTVERPIHGMSTVTHREIINKIEIKIKTKTTTNKKAATAAKVDVAAVAEVVNAVNPKASMPQPGKPWPKHPEKVIADERWMEVLANFICLKCCRHSVRMLPLFGSNATVIRLKCYRHLPRMLPSFGSNATVIQTRIGRKFRNILSGYFFLNHFVTTSSLICYIINIFLWISYLNSNK